jgi:hypothetical protein
VSANRGRFSFRWGAVTAVVLLLIAFGALAEAPRSTVVLVRADPPDPNLAEAYLRMNGELRAAGFDVMPAVGTRNVEPAKALAMAAEEQGPAAVVGIFESSSGGLEFWILDVRSGRTAVKRMERGGEVSRAPEILAISAVELLLASLSELEVKPTSVDGGQGPIASASASAAPSRIVEEPTSTRANEPHFGFELGLGSSLSTGGAGIAWLPTARLQWAPIAPVRLRLSGFGLGTHPEISAPEGTARTTQAIALAEVVVRPWDLSSTCPQFSLGAGAYDFQIEGRSVDGTEQATASRWSAAVDLGAELAWRQRTHFDFVLGAHTLWAEPYPSIRFFGVPRATAGRPTIVFAATIAGWL